MQSNLDVGEQAVAQLLVLVQVTPGSFELDHVAVPSISMLALHPRRNLQVEFYVLLLASEHGGASVSVCLLEHDALRRKRSLQLLRNLAPVFRVGADYVAVGVGHRPNAAAIRAPSGHRRLVVPVPVVVVRWGSSSCCCRSSTSTPPPCCRSSTSSARGYSHRLIHAVNTGTYVSEGRATVASKVAELMGSSRTRGHRPPCRERHRADFRRTDAWGSMVPTTSAYYFTTSRPTADSHRWRYKRGHHYVCPPRGRPTGSRGKPRLLRLVGRCSSAPNSSTRRAHRCPSCRGGGGAARVESIVIVMVVVAVPVARRGLSRDHVRGVRGHVGSVLRDDCWVHVAGRSSSAARGRCSR
mmetsp:Transcript_14012/g.34680  ORF Transcript_14012/g.34680 Transcript_14012/m.34680 type:complete len:354 (-) Transcript_14012:2037-3098(-)